MPRQPRARSKTGVYHVMLRGIDGRNIFLDSEDKDIFLEKLFKIREEVGFGLYGYCLMDNHIHLLLNESEEIGATIKRIAVGYVHWHNSKYGRTGHLFQNRFRSEVVETDGYLKTVLRYIHRNPIKGGLVCKLDQYQWSSYMRYVDSYNNKKVTMDTEFMKSYFYNYQDFNDFMDLENNDECLDFDEQKKYSDAGLKNIIKTEYNVGENLIDLPLAKRNEMLKEIYKGTGASIRQLSRVTGVGKRIIEVAIKCDR